MGLRCIMGHDYGALQTERERQDMGAETVVTVREFKECERCGHRRIISENKEVTSTSTASAAPSEESTESGSEIEDRGERREEYEDVSADEDDGVILEDEDGARQRGQWPEEDAEPDDEEAADTSDDEQDHEPWPTVEGEDEGYDAEPAEGGPSSVEFGGGLTPESSESERDDDPEPAGDMVDGTAERTDRQRSGGRGGQRSATVDATVVCPQCEHTAPAHGSSLRPGDICPSCHRGYLVERDS